MDRLEEIRQRTEAATPGPWGTPDNPIVPLLDIPYNAGLIAHAREDMEYLLSVVDRLNALHKREIIVTGEYAQRVIDLTARAEAAEARADAAIEDLRQNGFCGSCSGCNAPHDPNNITWCYSWEWRGPQAGKGDAE